MSIVTKRDALPAVEAPAGVMRVTERYRALPAVVARRLVSVPTCILLAALVVVASPLWVVAAMLADVAAAKWGRWPKLRTLAFVALYLGCEVAGILAALLLYVVTLGGWCGGADRYLQANAVLQRWWSTALFRGSQFIFSLKVVVEGVEQAARGPFLLFVRHASTADTLLAAALVANPHRFILRYVIKRELLWDPCLDIVGCRLPNAFIDREARNVDAEIDAVARLAVDLDEQSGVLIYPEGSRFSEAKLARAVQSLKRRGKQELAQRAADFRYVLPPRLRGPLALIEAAPDVDVVFLEHVGFEGAATLSRVWSGALVGRTIRVRLRRINAASIPQSGRAEWLYARWAELDAWIADCAIPRGETE